MCPAVTQSKERSRIGQHLANRLVIALHIVYHGKNKNRFSASVRKS